MMTATAQNKTNPPIRAIPPSVCLSIQHLNKAFPGAPNLALKGVELDIKRGEFVSLIGHSGCGKSTLLNLVAGLTAPSQGVLILDGTSISGPGPDRAMVFQQYSLLPWLTVRQNVWEAVDAVYRGSKSKAEKWAVCDSFIAKVGLTAHKDKKPHEISGGMKQRVAIARAFATHPKVLLLDEPFGALDALTKGSLHDELTDLWTSADTNIETVLMVTHDIDEAIYLSDRIVVMTNGPEATIGEIIPVNLPRPRDKRALIQTKEWAEIKDRLMFLLTVAYAKHD